MPFYIIQHDDAAPESVDSVMNSPVNEPDRYGVKYLNAHETEAGQLYTLINAANLNMVRASHKAHGLTIDTSKVTACWIGSLPTE